MTPCPHCGEDLQVPPRAATGTCPSCGKGVRFVAVPETPCPLCGAAVPERPDTGVLACPACRHVFTKEGRKVLLRTRCPRCRRVLQVGALGDRLACPHCRQPLETAGRLEQP